MRVEGGKGEEVASAIRLPNSGFVRFLKVVKPSLPVPDSLKGEWGLGPMTGRARRDQAQTRTH